MTILIPGESIFPLGDDGDPGGDVAEQPQNGAEKTDAKAPSFGVDGRSWCSAKGALRH